VTVAGQKGAELLLEMLLECTRKLALCSENQELDVISLTRHCREKLLALQGYMAGGNLGQPVGLIEAQGDSTKEHRLHDLLFALKGATEQSMRAINQRKDQIEDELATLRRSRKAASAYRNRK